MLVAGSSHDLPKMGIPLEPGHDPGFVMAGVLSLYDRESPSTKSLRRRGTWGLVAVDEVILTNPELRSVYRGQKIQLLSEAGFPERWLRRVDIDRLRPGAFAANRSVEGSFTTSLARVGLQTSR